MTGCRSRSRPWLWKRCARSGWWRTAGGPRSRFAAATSSSCWAAAATWSSSASRPTRGAGSSRGDEMGYVELHCHSAYSFLDGASAPEELARRAAELGFPALALTDHDGVWGAMEFAQACKSFGVRPIVGAELTVDDFHLTILVESQEGWRNLCRLVTRAHRDTRPAPDREALPPA